MSSEPLNGFEYGLKDDPQVRLGFVRKVYGILSAQLSVTAVYCLFVMSLKENHIETLASIYSGGLVVTVLIAYIASICALTCCRMDKAVPVNYILLAIFTGCVSYIVGLACLPYDAQTVVEAAFLTAGVTIGITLYAVTTKSDFTVFGPILFVIGMIFAVASLLSFMFGPTMRLMYACFGVFLFSFYLLVDTQMIIGGQNRKYQIDEDSYILAAVALYLDIINLFLYILEILGKKD